MTDIDDVDEDTVTDNIMPSYIHRRKDPADLVDTDKDFFHDVIGKKVMWRKRGSTCLNARELAYLVLYYEEGLSYAKIATRDGISTERVRNVLARALRKLRHPLNSELLRPYNELEYN